MCYPRACLTLKNLELYSVNFIRIFVASMLHSFLGGGDGVTVIATGVETLWSAILISWRRR